MAGLTGYYFGIYFLSLSTTQVTLHLKIGNDSRHWVHYFHNCGGNNSIYHQAGQIRHKRNEEKEEDEECSSSPTASFLQNTCKRYSSFLKQEK